MKTVLGFLESRWAGFIVAGVGLVNGLLFCLIVYPLIAGPFHAVLDADDWDLLGLGLRSYGTLSYHPDPSPTVNRGPGYPALLAVVRLATGDHLWPLPIHVVQCLLLGLTSLLVWWLGSVLVNRRAGAVGGLVCACYPFLIWYTSRIWVESLAAFLFILIVASVVAALRRASMTRYALAGAAIGAACLVKATFLPFIAVIPALIVFIGGKRSGWWGPLVVAVTACLVVIPWTIRNEHLTGRVIPVHLLGGFNLAIGDGMLEYLGDSPLGCARVWDRAFAENIVPEEAAIPDSLPLWEKECRLDSILVAQSRDRYRAQPTFLIRKAALNSVSFWALGETPKKTAVISLMQVPLVVLFLIGAARHIRRDGWRTPVTVLVGLWGGYYLAHIPVFAIARFSVVLTPVMCVIVGAVISAWMPDGKASDDAPNIPSRRP